MNDPDIVRFFPTPQVTRARDIAYWSDFCAPDSRNQKFAIVDKREQAPIGLVGLFALNQRLGCALTGTVIGAKQKWGKGLAWEAKILCLNYGFDVLKLKYAACHVSSENLASIRHVTSCGFVEHARNPNPQAGLPGDEITFVLTADRWASVWQQYSARFQPSRLV